MTQAELFEPTGMEVLRLAGQHMTQAERFMSIAEVWASRGCDGLARMALAESTRHEFEAVCLGMLAEFERLGGVAGWGGRGACPI